MKVHQKTMALIIKCTFDEGNILFIALIVSRKSNIENEPSLHQQE